METKTIIGIAAGILNLIALSTYFFATVRQQMRPNRAGWGIWMLESLLLLSSYYYSTPQHETIWVPLGDVIGIGAVFLASLWYGEGGWARLDRWCLAGSALSIPLWAATRSPLSALLVNLFIDCLGALPTVKKVYLNPTGERRLPWALFFLGNLLNLAAINQWNFAVAIYPLAMVGISGTIAILVLRSERKKNGRIFTTHSDQETRNVGTKIATELRAGDVVCLYGELGAGKTTLVKGIAAGLGVQEEITSPTFTLMNVYQINNKQLTINRLVHIDTYRLKNEQELLNIGVEDYLGQLDTVTIVEWPEKIEGLLKRKRVIKIALEHGEREERKISVKDF